MHDDQTLHARHRRPQVLPDSLTDALAQAAASTALAVERGASRCVVEILLAEFWDPVSGAVFNEEGDQMRWWKLSKRFVENLQEMSGGRPIKVVRARLVCGLLQTSPQIYPDMGVTAMLKNQWPDATFAFASLNDRRPVAADDAIVVMAAPDPPGARGARRDAPTRCPTGLDDVLRVADELMTSEQNLVLFNPRLARCVDGTTTNQ